MGALNRTDLVERFLLNLPEGQWFTSQRLYDAMPYQAHISNAYFTQILRKVRDSGSIIRSHTYPPTYARRVPNISFEQFQERVWGELQQWANEHGQTMILDMMDDDLEALAESWRNGRFPEYTAKQLLRSFHGLKAKF